MRKSSKSNRSNRSESDQRIKHNTPESKKLNEEIVKFAKEFPDSGLKFIAAKFKRSTSGIHKILLKHNFSLRYGELDRQ